MLRHIRTASLPSTLQSTRACSSLDVVEASARRFCVDQQRKHRRQLVREWGGILGVSVNRLVLQPTRGVFGTDELRRQAGFLVGPKCSNDGFAIGPEDGRLVKDAVGTGVGEHAVVDAAAGGAQTAIFARQLQTARDLRVLLHVADWVLDGVQEKGVPLQLIGDHVERTGKESVALRTRWRLAAIVVLLQTSVDASRQAAE